MGKRIVVNAGLTETRVAVQEANLLVELYLERRERRSIVGNVYKGVVTNVLPGMQAAFVDIGLTKDAFLYVGDYTADLGDYAREMLDAEDDDDDDLAADDDVVPAEPDAARDATAADDAGAVDTEASETDVPVKPKRAPTVPIENLLRKGQEVLVQVSKESLGTKGARVTSFISLPGRYLVYMPQTNHIGVSRRIRDEQERDRLRAQVRALHPPAGGFIVRTNAEGKGESELAPDVEFLGRLWSQIHTRYDQSAPPAVLHEEMDLTFRVVRDLLSPEVDEFVVDSGEVRDKCVEWVQALAPALVERVKLYEQHVPIFESFGIEREIEKALRRRVWLRSGGYIVIDPTEALVSIDVNTGKYVGKRDFDQTVLKINLESVAEIVRQIRLRDLGGIIIIDFIDMEHEDHRDQVYRALKRALADDKARTNVLEISELGLVEMTRKRVRQDLRSLLSVACPTCKGNAVLKSDATLAAEILRVVQAKAPDARGKEILVRVHPELAAYLDGAVRDAIAGLASSFDVKITVQHSGAHVHREAYEIHVR